MTCVICERRPANGNGQCHNCAAKIESERRKRQGPQPVKYLVYRGMVAGLVPNGKGTLKAVSMRLNPERLPKSRVIDLNHYCEGFSRDQIKRFKAAVLKVNGA